MGHLDMQQARDLFRYRNKGRNKLTVPWIAIGKTGSLDERLNAVRMKAVVSPLGPRSAVLLPFWTKSANHSKKNHFEL